MQLKIKRALLSVWDKDCIIELGKFLADQNIEILSTGGTKKVLEKAGLDITSISFITGSGAVMDGRVKTLHPKIFGGILADRENPQHVDDLEDLHGLAIAPSDPNIIYTGTIYDPSVTEVYSMMGAVIFTSRDGGITWKESSNGFPIETPTFPSTSFFTSI